MEKILISRCLLGERCRWDGAIISNDKVKHLNDKELFAICPEMEGGLPCPRPKSEIINGNGLDVIDGKSKVVNIDGGDVTDNYLRGAQAALNLALSNGVGKAILKDKSPSCGVKYIYNEGRLIDGMGVTAALLRRHKIDLAVIE